MQLEVIGAEFFRTPPLKRCFADLPAFSQLLLIQVPDFHGDSSLLNDHH